MAPLTLQLSRRLLWIFLLFCLFPLVDLDIVAYASRNDIVRPHYLDIWTFPEGTPCVNADGNGVIDGATWSTNSSHCHLLTCFHGYYANYTIVKSCRTIPDTELPDPAVCRTAQDLTMTYPDCCPTIQCDDPQVLPDDTVSGCVDLAPSSSCDWWRDAQDGCTTLWTHIYNITVVYCRATCGFC